MDIPSVPEKFSSLEVTTYLEIVLWMWKTNSLVLASTEHSRRSSTVNKVYAPVCTVQSFYTLPVLERVEDYFYKIDEKISV